MDVENPDDDAIPIRTRRRPPDRSKAILYAALGGGALLVLVLGVMLIAGRGSVSGSGKPGGGISLLGPSASSEGQTWNHAELAAFLQSKGLSFTPIPSFEKPLCQQFSFSNGEYVEVTKYGSSQTARDEAGSPYGVGFSWGRFAFHSYKKQSIKQIQDALE